MARKPFHTILFNSEKSSCIGKVPVTLFCMKVAERPGEENLQAGPFGLHRNFLDRVLLPGRDDFGLKQLEDFGEPQLFR